MEVAGIQAIKRRRHKGENEMKIRTSKLRPTTTLLRSVHVHFPFLHHIKLTLSLNQVMRLLSLRTSSVVWESSTKMGLVTLITNKGGNTLDLRESHTDKIHHSFLFIILFDTLSRMNVRQSSISLYIYKKNKKNKPQWSFIELVVDL